MKKNYLKSKKIGKKGMATFTLVLLLLLLLLVVVVVVVVVGVGFSNTYRAMDEFMNKKPLNIRKRLMMRNCWNKCKRNSFAYDMRTRKGATMSRSTTPFQGAVWGTGLQIQVVKTRKCGSLRVVGNPTNL